MRASANAHSPIRWLLPTSFYTEAMIGVMNSKGGTAYSFRSEDSPEIHGGQLEERAVKDFGDRNGPNGCRQPVTGKIADHDME